MFAFVLLWCVDILLVCCFSGACLWRGGWGGWFYVAGCGFVVVSLVWFLGLVYVVAL